MRRLPLGLATGFACFLFAQERVHEATDARIRSEKMKHSQLMHTLHILADRYGPRVTGTPNHEEAAKWVVALWSGEEEGLLGSLASVKQHFGTFENQKPEFAKLDCYFNVDARTGRLRGGSIFGPAESAAVLRPVLLKFKEWGVAGINVTSGWNTGRTVSTSFNNLGLPGIGFQQDLIEYMVLTHHTNLGTYERMIPEDVKEAAGVVASAVWHVANRDSMVPRFSKEKMPAPVEAR